MRRLALALLLVVAFAAPAAAHGDTGLLEVVEATPGDDLSVRYVVLLRYANDGDPVDGATLTVTASGPDGGAVSAPMAGIGDGRYEATVAFPSPGVWGVRIATGEPAAVVERTETVGAPTTTVPTTTSSTSTTVAAPAGTSDDDGGGGPMKPASIVALAVAALAIVFVLRRQRRRAATPS